MPVTNEVEELLQVIGPFYELVDEKRKITQVSDLSTGKLTQQCPLRSISQNNNNRFSICDAAALQLTSVFFPHVFYVFEFKSNAAKIMEIYSSDHSKTVIKWSPMESEYNLVNNHFII